MIYLTVFLSFCVGITVGFIISMVIKVNTYTLIKNDKENNNE